jgi:hypothetical protein
LLCFSRRPSPGAESTAAQQVFNPKKGEFYEAKKNSIPIAMFAGLLSGALVFRFGARSGDQRRD